MYIAFSVALLILGYAVAYPLMFIAFIPLLLFQNKHIGKSSLFRIFANAFIVILLFYAAIHYQIAIDLPVEMLMYVVLSSLLLAAAVTLPWVVLPILGMQRAMIALPFYWILVEWLQLRFSVGSAVLGNALPSAFTGWYAYMGVLGGSLWVWLVNLVGFAVVRSFMAHKQWKPFVGQSVLMVLLLIVLPAFALPRPMANEEKQTVTVGVDEGAANVSLSPGADKPLVTMFVPIHAPYDYVSDVWNDALVVETDAWMLPLGMQQRINSVRAREIYRPVVWVRNGIIYAATREGELLSHETTLGLETSADKTYFARTGSFPVRIGVFVAIFMLLYTVSFSLRGASLHRKR